MEISRTDFMRKMRYVTVTKAECAGCCNVMRIHGISGNGTKVRFEIESITEHGVPSMTFYDRTAKQPIPINTNGGGI